MDSLWFGCIPVFLSDHYVPPIHGLIQWDSISLSIPEHQVGDVEHQVGGVEHQVGGVEYQVGDVN